MPFHLLAQLKVLPKNTHNPQNLQNCAKLKLKYNEMKIIGNATELKAKMQTRFRASALQG